MAHVYHAQGNLRGAKYHYEAALAQDGGHVEAHYNLGLVLAKLGDRQGAVRQLQHVLLLQPDHSMAQEALHSITSWTSG